MMRGLLVIIAFSLLLVACRDGEPHERFNPRTTSVNLVVALEMFYEEYFYLPGGKGGTSPDRTVTTAGETGSPMMASLLGLRVAIDENPKFLQFVESQFAKNGKDGLVKINESANLYDPWGNPYYIRLNSDGDNQLKVPVTNEVLFDRRAVVWSLGPDGKSGTPETDRDNVYSWYRD